MALPQSKRGEIGTEELEKLRSTMLAACLAPATMDTTRLARSTTEWSIGVPLSSPDAQE